MNTLGETGMRFRHASTEDVTGIMCLIHEAQRFMAGLGIDQWQDGYPSEEIIREDIAVGRGYVIAGEDEIGAYAVLTTEPEPAYDEIRGEGWQLGERYLTIHRIAVSDRYRGRGLATKLLENALRMAGEQDVPALRGDTHYGNRAMRGFLTKHGFVHRGEITVECEGDTRRVAYERPVVL